MRLQTKYFGEIEIPESSFISFQEGLFGFEEEKKFALLPFGEDADLLICMQSVKTPELAFTLVNPFRINPTYRPVLAKEELSELGVPRSEDLCYYALCILREPVLNSTVNLRCPIAINDDTNMAMQVILEGYEMRQPLSAMGKAGDAC